MQRIQLLIVKLKSDFQTKKNNIWIYRIALLSQDFAACLSVMEMKGKLNSALFFGEIQFTTEIKCISVSNWQLELLVRIYLLRKCSRTRRMRRRMLLKAKSSFLLSSWRNHWLWSSSDPSEEATAAPLHAQAPSLLFWLHLSLESAGLEIIRTQCTAN